MVSLYLLIGVAYILLWAFTWWFVYEKPVKEERKRSSILFNASVTERAVPAREVFETLENAGIKPNFLGI